MVHVELAGGSSHRLVRRADIAKLGAPQLDWDTEVERADATHCTYWITVKNLTNTAVTFEGRYAVLN